MSTKEQWPELVGKTGADAQAAIQKERPELTVQVCQENAPCTMDFRTDRVRIFVDSNGKVTNAPHTG